MGQDLSNLYLTAANIGYMDSELEAAVSSLSLPLQPNDNHDEAKIEEKIYETFLSPELRNPIDHIDLQDFQDSIVRQNLKNYQFPKPLYYKSCKSPKTWIILTSPAPSFNHKNGVYIYDLSCKIWRLFAKYPRELRLKNHNHTLDRQHNLLFIFGGKYKNTFYILNLKTKQWIYNTNAISFPFISSLGNSVKYSSQCKEFIDNLTVSINNLYELLMNKSQNQLCSLTVVSTKDNDYQQNMSGNSWFNECMISALKPHRNKFVESDTDTHLVMIYGYILVVYVVPTITNLYMTNVHCIDVLNEAYIKFERQIAMSMDDPRASDATNFVGECEKGFAFMGCEKELIRFMLDELIPNQWKTFYNDSYDKLLVMGYIRSYIIVKLPTCIFTLVYSFYPGYLHFVD